MAVLRLAFAGWVAVTAGAAAPSGVRCGCGALTVCLPAPRYPGVCFHTVAILKPCNSVWGSDLRNPLTQHHFMTTDYTRDCDTDAHAFVRVLAWVMLAALPVGFPLSLPRVCQLWLICAPTLRAWRPGCELRASGSAVLQVAGFLCWSFDCQQASPPSSG